MPTSNVLLSVCAVAGLASSAFAQNPQFDMRIVLDSDPSSPFFGTSLAALPGVGTTLVGLTLQARVTTTGTFANFGIAGFANSAAVGVSFIRHNDSVSNQTSALWSNVANVWRRGLTGQDAQTRGVFSPFRRAVTTAENLESGNGTFTAPSTSPTTPFLYGNMPNGFIQTGIPGDNGAQIRAMDALLTDSPVSYTNFAAGATTTTATISPWANLYRFLFAPRTNVGDSERQVTITAGGRLRWGGSQIFSGGLFRVNPSAVGTTPAFFTAASVTFTVPTPGAAALLGVAGLAVARRRRA
jgi:MYXO-CTERM domain-containing protein